MRRVGLALLLLVGIGAWFGLTGYYQLTAGEAAVILRLGRFSRIETREGPHFHLPAPIETRDVVHVGVSQRREFGNVDATEPDAIAETAMQTGDNNIVLVEFVVQYRSATRSCSAIASREPDAVLREAAQAAMREVVGRESIDGVIATGRGRWPPRRRSCSRSCSTATSPASRWRTWSCSTWRRRAPCARRSPT